MEQSTLHPTAPTSVRPPPRDEAEPRHIGRYRVLRRLADGGMSAVYLGYDPTERKPVALKVLADHLTDDKSSVDRFLREARVGQTLRHLHLVQTLYSGRDTATGRHFLVMEYVDGPSGQFLLDRTGPLAVRDAVRVILDAAYALEFLHARRLVHRDIKPGNILIATSGVAKLADLGLAKELDEASDLTALHQGFGTSWYMPPEQVLNARFVDGRSDLYALGATLYHLLTGSVPFPGPNHAAVVAAKQRGTFAPAGSLNAAVPVALDAILAKMLAKDPRARYQTASELIAALEGEKLADKLPSFIDVDVAMQDPAARARLTGNGQPTSPDVNAAPPPAVSEKTPVPVAAEIWHLRFRDEVGGWSLRRATTNQVLHGLRAGYWPTDLEAARGTHRHFRPIAVYPEFRASPREHAAAPPAPVVATRSRAKYWQVLVSTGFGLGLLAAASAAAVCRLFAAL